MIALVFAVWLAGIPAAGAQMWQRGTIEGTVTDPSGGVIVGASVTLTGTALIGGSQTVTTNDEGRYRFADLLPGTYSVLASATGFRPRRLPAAELPVERTLTVDLRLMLAAQQASVDVVAEAPLIDVTTATVDTNISAAQLQNLPLPRTLSGVMNLAPGVTSDVVFGATQTSANRFTVDGVGVVGAWLGEQWVNPGYNWLSSVQVVAVGAPAQYGGFTGGVANAILRSGANRVSGLVEHVRGVPRWTGDNTMPLNGAFTPTSAQELADWGLNGQLGTPLVRDRLWLFGGVESARHRYRAFGFEGPDSTKDTAARWMLKADAAVSRPVRLQGYYLRDRSDVEGAELSAQQPTADSSADVHRRKHAWNARLSAALSNATLLELYVGGNGGPYRRDPHPPATREGPPAHIDLMSGIVSGNTTMFTTFDSETTSLNASVTTSLRLWGRHDLRTGVGFERARATTVGGYPGGIQYYDSGGVPVSAEIWSSSTVRPANDNASLYVQDKWSIGRVTLEPGLRVEFHRGNVPAAGTVLSTSPVGLRFGAAWDVTGTHRTVARAHYGRYFDPAFGYLFSFADRAESPPVIGVDILAPGVYQEAYRYYALANTEATIGPDLTQPYVDQVSAGLEREVSSDVTVQTQYVHRRFGGFLGYVDPRIDDYRSFTVHDPGPDGIADTADDGGSLTAYSVYPGTQLFELANVAGASRDYHALQAVVRKRLGRGWQVDGSWTWSRSHGTVNNRPFTNAGFWSLSPAGIGANAQARAYAERRPTFDYSEAKVLGAWSPSLLGGFTLAGIYRWQTGTTWNRLLFVRGAGFVPAEPGGSRRTPSVGAVDVRLEKLLRLQGGLGVYADVFNLTNTGTALAYVARSGASFGFPSAWTDPRTIRFGVRVTFPRP